MYSVSTADGTRFAAIGEAARLMPYMEMIAICCENYMEHKNKFNC
jgi:hypothetical protein